MNGLGRISTAGRLCAVLAVPLLVVFGPVLFRDRQFAFQDAGHYYYPLLQRVQQEWDAGRWPLWAPEASAGTPLLGNPTAAVLYPGKAVFFLLPHPWAVRAFAVGHVALAYAAMLALLRGWRVSTTGAVLGALAYAFGVPVLCLTSNPIFLVGAAWAPVGFLAADRWLRGGGPLSLAGLAVALALQVLGGDPEAAYLTVAAALGYAAGLAVAGSGRGTAFWLRAGAAGLAAAYAGLLGLSWWSARSALQAATAGPQTSASWPPPPRAAIVGAAWLALAALAALRLRGRADPDDPARRSVRRAFGLVGAAALALAIAGAQVLPVVESTGQSFRAAESAGLHDVYPYSTHPLQLLDAAWPGLFGTLEGGYRSWLNALPPKPEGRLWVPSVYLGGLTLALAAAGVGFRGGSPWRAWLSVVAVVGLLAALGYHGGPLLWARWLAGPNSPLGPLEPSFSWEVRHDGFLRDGDGGLYWLLASALPGFRSFRYPSKLLVFAALGVCGLAGAGWDRVTSGQGGRARRTALVLLSASVVALGASLAADRPLRAGFNRLADTLRHSDEPLDTARAVLDLRLGLARGALAAAVSIGLLTLAARRPRLAGSLAVLTLWVDLGLSGTLHVVTVPQSAFEGAPRALELIRAAERAGPSPGPFRVQHVGRWWPSSWARADGAPRSFETITRWERDTLRPLYNWPLGVESTIYLDTIEPLDYGLFFLPSWQTPSPETARAHGLKPDQKVWYVPRRGLDLWNTRYFIVPARLMWDNPSRGYASLIPNSTFLYPPLGAFDGPDGPARRARWGSTEDFRVLRNDRAYPRAWIVHRAVTRPPVRGLRVADRAQTMRDLLYQDDGFWHLPGVAVRDPRQTAWIETDRPKDLAPFLSRAAPDASETAVVTLEQPQRVELTAVLRTPGIVVVSDRYDPGWTVTIDGRPAEVLRANRAMRGVVLPAGTHHLVFRYDPLSFRLGLALSALGLIGLAGLLMWGALTGGRRRGRADVPSRF